MVQLLKLLRKGHTLECGACALVIEVGVLEFPLQNSWHPLALLPVAALKVLEVRCSSCFRRLQFPVLHNLSLAGGIYPDLLSKLVDPSPCTRDMAVGFAELLEKRSLHLFL